MIMAYMIPLPPNKVPSNGDKHNNDIEPTNKVMVTSLVYLLEYSIAFIIDDRLTGVYKKIALIIRISFAYVKLSKPSHDNIRLLKK